MALILLGVAHAQPSSVANNKAEADRLFEEGRALLAEGKRDEACDRFEHSFRKDPRAVGTMLNLGLCREETGQVASAIRFYGEARDRAHDQRLAEHEEAAKRKIALLFPRVPRMTIQLPPGLGPNTRVLVDDEVIPLQLLEDIQVDPGTRLIAVTAPGKLPWETKREVKEAERPVVQVPPLEGAKTVVVREPANRRALWGKISTASGAALAIAGIGLGFYARSYYWDQFPAASRDGQAAPREAGHPCWTSLGTTGGIVRNCSQLGSERLETARTLAHVSTAVGIAGGAIAIAGAVLWLTAPSTEAQTRVDVAFTSEAASFAVTHSF